MFFCCECCVLLGRGLCEELITRPEESYRLWCVVVCDLETSRVRRPWPALGRSATKKKSCILLVTFIIVSRCADSWTSGIPEVSNTTRLPSGGNDCYVHLLHLLLHIKRMNTFRTLCAHFLNVWTNCSAGRRFGRNVTSPERILNFELFLFSK